MMKVKVSSSSRLPRLVPYSIWRTAEYSTPQKNSMPMGLNDLPNEISGLQTPTMFQHQLLPFWNIQYDQMTPNTADCDVVAPLNMTTTCLDNLPTSESGPFSVNRSKEVKPLLSDSDNNGIYSDSDSDNRLHCNNDSALCPAEANNDTSLCDPGTFERTSPLFASVKDEDKPLLSSIYEDISQSTTSSKGRCEEDEDEEADSPRGSTAQYVSANCIVFTHYTGDVASVVDEHFSRALYSQDKASPGCDKDCSPMSARNFPPSFWNQSSVSLSHGHSDLYGDSMYHGATAHTPADPWHTHYQQYTAAAHHHRAVHDYHHHHQHMAGYGGLLLPPSSRLPPHAQYPKTVDWNHRLHHEPSAHHALDAASSYASYPSMAGLDPPMQETSKDLYWI